MDATLYLGAGQAIFLPFSNVLLKAVTTSLLTNL